MVDEAAEQRLFGLLDMIALGVGALRKDVTAQGAEGSAHRAETAAHRAETTAHRAETTAHRAETLAGFGRVERRFGHLETRVEELEVTVQKGFSRVEFALADHERRIMSLEEGSAQGS